MLTTVRFADASATSVAVLATKYDAVRKSFHDEHANSELSHIEKLKAVTLLTEQWTTDNGCLTAANKLQRRVVIDMFPREFEEVKEMGVF
eukprot:scaffold381_cov138-Cylindrotheca_fusiformis.AAC.17